MRGIQALYNTYLEPPAISAGNTAGRRNALLAARFYYYMHIKKLRFDAILVNLQNEFFLSESRIVDLLNDNKPMLDSYMNHKPEARELKREYCWLVWE